MHLQGTALSFSMSPHHSRVASELHFHCSVTIIPLLGALYLPALATLKGRINFWSWLPSCATPQNLYPGTGWILHGLAHSWVLQKERFDWVLQDSSKITPTCPVWKASVMSVQQLLILRPKRRSKSKQKILQQPTQWSEAVGRPCALPCRGKWEPAAGGSRKAELTDAVSTWPRSVDIRRGRGWWGRE